MFLDDLKTKLRSVGLKDRETSLKLKKEEHTKKGFSDGTFSIWDHRCYDQNFIQPSLDLDETLVKVFLPVSVIVPQIIQIYQNLLSIKFVEMKGETWHSGNAPTVHVAYQRCLIYSTDVQQYSVWKKDAKTPEEFFGYCYLDLSPRSNAETSLDFGLPF